MVVEALGISLVIVEMWREGEKRDQHWYPQINLKYSQVEWWMWEYLVEAKWERKGKQFWERKNWRKKKKKKSVEVKKDRRRKIVQISNSQNKVEAERGWGRNYCEGVTGQ